MVSVLELQGMARVVKYLRLRSAGFHRIVDRWDPETEADRDLARVTRAKACALTDAATMIEDGISRELGEPGDPSLGFKAWTVCSACGTRVMHSRHTPECSWPCYESHIDPCPHCPKEIAG